MKTKLFTLFLALIASVGTMFAASGTCGENLTWDLTDGVLTISGTGAMNNFSDTRRAPWYSYRSSIIEVSIGNSVTNIGSWAFSSCTGFTSITIPNSVTSIGNMAFYGCSSLTSVTIGNSVTKIRDYAFEGCVGLTSIIIPNSVANIGTGAFYHCTGLTSITIPNSVTYINNSAFIGCIGLTSMVVENANTTYDSRVNCNAIIETPTNTLICGCKSTIIPNSVTSIGNSALAGCTGLTSVTIPNSVTSIGDYAFSHCIKLEEIYNYATTPQEIYNVFGGKEYESEGVVYGPVDKSTCTLYVPAGSIDLYKSAEEWKDFTNILPISAEEKNVDVVEVETSESAASIAWPQVSGAYTYELVIKDIAGNIVCTLVFNAQGQLLSIKFNAPAQNGAPQHTQAAGFAFTVTSLDAGTNYGYSITAKNESGTILNVEEGTFRTQSYEAVDEVSDGQSRGTKFLRDGQILIQKGDKTFDLRGQEVK